MPSNVKLLAGASGGEPTDANFKNVTLLLHGDGSNGAQNNTFIDSSTNNFTITRNGNTTQGSFSPYGSNWSNYFDGNGDYLYAASNAAFGVGTGDFTIECWVFPIGAWTSGGYNCLFQVDGTGLYFGQNNAGFGLRQSGTANIISYGTSPTLNTWTHVAIVRSGTTVTMYYNGVSVATATSSANFSSGNAWVGADAGPSSYYNGYISNLRLVKGTAVYTAAFTPPTAPLTAITNTSLLTCAYNRFRDGSTNNFTITRNGDVKVTNFAPFAPSSAYSTTTNGGSAYFDGTGDYLNTPSNSAFAFGTGNFTIEGWVFTTGTATTWRPIMSVGAGSAGNLIRINQNVFTSGYLGVLFPNDTNNGDLSYDTGSALPLNQWVHIALVRNGSTLTLYQNGTNVLQKTVGFNFTNTTGSSIGYGMYSGDGYFQGYMSGVRILKGAAQYTADFTPPTSPPTAITNTSLLLNATNAAIFDNSMKNDLETVGNAQISTSVKKFGTGSMYFDGTGDYLKAIDSSELDFGSGDFTIEAWVNFSTSTSGVDYPIVVQGTNAFTSNASFLFGRHNSNKLRFIFTDDGTGSSGYKIVDSTNNFLPTTGVWYHLAVTRSGSTFRLFVDGTQVGSNTYSQSIYNGTRPITIGADDGASVALNGYIDDLRVTKGVARYTANFTAPTAPFPNK